MTKIINVDGIEYSYIRNGCDKSGWTMSPNIFYRCVDCGYLMSGDPNVDDACTCGKLNKDTGFGRFGSELGDDAIEVYKKRGLTIFCLGGYDGEKILLEFSEDIGFPNETNFNGGYDILCSLQIAVGGYHAVEDRYYSSTDALNNFLAELKEIYHKLQGEAEYRVLYEDNLSFKVIMSTRGHASIIGRFRANFILQNVLEFEIATDQTCFVDTIQSIENFLKRYKSGNCV